MVNRFFRKAQVKWFGKFSSEKVLIEKNFNCIKCSYDKVKLVCTGSYKPTNTLYKYQITYNGMSDPSVKVIEPVIPFNHDIHMYPDKSLCLHYPPDEDWTPSDRLYKTIVPWIHEWFVFYELYLITGKWEHPFVPHIIKSKEEENT